MLRIAVLCSGGGTNLQNLIDAADRGTLNAEIGLVVVSKPGAYALERAKARDIPCECMRKKDFPEPGSYENQMIALIKEHNIDLIVLAGFTVIMDGSFVKAFRDRIINIHPALLPKYGGKGYYGINVHRAVIDAGEAESGATVHYVTEEVDGGPVIHQKTVPVLADDTPETLQKRIMEEAERVVLPEAVNMVVKKIYRIGEINR